MRTNARCHPPESWGARCFGRRNVSSRCGTDANACKSSDTCPRRSSRRTHQHRPHGFRIVLAQRNTTMNQSTKGRARRVACRGVKSFFVLAAAGLALSGCASSKSEGGLLDKTLEMVGFKKPEVPELPADGIKAPAQPKKIVLRLHAGDLVNTDINGRPLSLVARVYKLKSPSALLQAPYDTFKDPALERQALGSDIVEVREVVLTPGKKYEVVETMPNEATHLAVVALLRAPDPQRWRFVFDAKDAARTGITLGLHACAMSVAEGEPLSTPVETRRLAGMQCPA